MRAFVANLVVTSVFLAILLGSAGRWDFGPAWVYAALGLTTNVMMRLALRGRAELARERAAPGKRSQAWDRHLLGLGALLTLATLVVAGLDAGRCQWSPPLSWGWTAIGACLALAGSATFVLAMRANPFFSAVVRIQHDRGHAVCTKGPYAVVRHPGYAGMIVGTLALPLLFRSAWAIVPVLGSVVVLIVRTRREDALLANELDGYRDYMRQTRWRLLPGVW